MIQMDNLEKLKILTGEQNEALLSLLLSEAEDFVKSYTNRTWIPKNLEKPVLDLSIIAYNRRGTEGELGRSGGGESYTFDSAPKHVYDILKQYRLARCGGHAFEKKQPEIILPEEQGK